MNRHFFRRTSFWLGVGFFLMGVLTRIPFRSQMLYHWDSVNFALALERFDVRIHQPHPPGYLVYVLMGRLATLLIHDPNAAYVGVSVLFSGLAVFAAFALGQEMFGEKAGLAAGLLTLTSPAIWFYGEVALTYILEAFFVTAIALAAYRTLRDHARGAAWFWGMSALLGIAGGIRQTTLVLLLPLWLFALTKVPWRHRFGAGALLGSIVLAWLIPTVILSGGWHDYLAASRAIGGGVISGFALLGAEPLWAPMGRLALYLFYGLLGGTPLLIYQIARRKPVLSELYRDNRTRTLLLWLGPNLLFYAPLVRAPGHTFSFLPALLVLAGAGAATIFQERQGNTAWPLRGSVLGLPILLNVLFFLMAPPFLLGEQRVALIAPGWAAIRYRDQSLTARITYIKQNCSPDQTVILSNGLDFRHPDFYLREYPTYRCATVPITASVPLSPSIRTVVLFGEDLQGESCQMAVVGPGERLCQIPRAPDQSVVILGTTVHLQPPVAGQEEDTPLQILGLIKEEK